MAGAPQPGGLPAARTVMLVGAGRFGLNYPPALAALGSEQGGGRHRFERLIVTRTRLPQARQTAAAVARATGRAFARVEGVAVADSAQLERALETYRPALICIAARDARRGDVIHARYVPVALEYGAVLCEKPFSRTDDRTAVPTLHRLIAHHKDAPFSLHLPLAVVREAMLAHVRLGKLLNCARRIEFLWEKTGGSPDWAADLALHPWSLIPHRQGVNIAGVIPRGQGIEIDFDAPACSGRMVLRPGSFRGMCVDDRVLRFEFSGGMLHVLESAVSWPDILSGERTRQESVLLSVPDPLKQHILALLDGRPVVDLRQTLDSQLFLAQAAS